MYSMALWFWSGVVFGAVTLALVAVSVRSLEALGARARRAGSALREQARHSLTESLDSFLPSSPSHPSTPGVH
jgi:hypothetical protein